MASNLWFDDEAAQMEADPLPDDLEPYEPNRHEPVRPPVNVRYRHDIQDNVIIPSDERNTTPRLAALLKEVLRNDANLGRSLAAWRYDIMDRRLAVINERLTNVEIIARPNQAVELLRDSLTEMRNALNMMGGRVQRLEAQMAVHVQLMENVWEVIGPEFEAMMMPFEPDNMEVEVPAADEEAEDVDV